MDPRMLTAIKTLLDNAPLFPRYEAWPAFARMQNDDIVELLVPGQLDGGDTESYLVDLRTLDPIGPTHNGMHWPPPAELGFIDVSILVQRAEENATD